MICTFHLNIHIQIICIFTLLYHHRAPLSHAFMTLDVGNGDIEETALEM